MTAWAVGRWGAVIGLHTSGPFLPQAQRILPTRPKSPPAPANSTTGSAMPPTVGHAAAAAAPPAPSSSPAPAAAPGPSKGGPDSRVVYSAVAPNSRTTCRGGRQGCGDRGVKRMHAPITEQPIPCSAAAATPIFSRGSGMAQRRLVSLHCTALACMSSAAVPARSRPSDWMSRLPTMVPRKPQAAGVLVGWLVGSIGLGHSRLFWTP